MRRHSGSALTDESCQAGAAADIFQKAVHLDIVAHADDRNALTGGEHQRMQSDANHGFHAGEDADGDFDGLSGTHGVPRTVQRAPTRSAGMRSLGNSMGTKTGVRPCFS